MARLPTLWNATNGNLDNNNWGSILNAFLLTAHNTDGTDLAGWINVQDPAYGATGDGSTDDSTAFADAIEALPTSGGVILIPPGTYRFTAAGLDIIDNTASNNRKGITLLGLNGGGSGGSLNTVLEFNGTGGASSDFIRLHSRDCVFQNLVIRSASGKTLRSLVDIDQASTQTTTCTNNAFINCRFTGGGATVTNLVRIAATAAANCEYMRFDRCYLASASNACVYIADTVGQSKLNRFTQCSFNSAAYGIQQNLGSFTTDKCTFGSLTTAAIEVTSQTDAITIRDTDEESCARLFLSTGGSNTPWPVTIDGGRFAANSLHADGEYIKWTNGGPLRIEGGFFGSGTYVSAFKVTAHCAAPGSTLIAIGNQFPTDTPFLTDGTDRFRLISIGNRGLDSGSNKVMIGDQFVRYVSDATGNLTTQDFRVDVVATGSLPAAATAQNGRILIEDGGAGDRNLILYAGGQRFRIDGGAAF